MCGGDNAETSLSRCRLANLLRRCLSDAWRQTNDLSHQEERRRHVCVCGLQHGGGAGQRPRGAGGVRCVHCHVLL